MSNQHAPRVSVVMPCYNQARFLPEAVASVVAQTMPDWELLIVDDGSPDDTAVVAQRLIAAHAGRRITLIRQPNSGPGASRNAAIRQARGAYILPLDADDTVAPTMLADTMAVLEALLTVIPQELSRGNIVELGDFGNFWLRTSTEGADTPEAVRATQIAGVLPRFNAGKEFKKVLDTIEYVKTSEPAPVPVEE